MQQEQSLVLLITDNRRITDLVVGAIESPAGQEYRLEMSGTLDEALGNLTDGEPMVVLLDLNLPDSQGLSTYMMLQSWSATIPVITLVGEKEEDLGGNTVAKGAIEYINWQTATQELITRTLRYTTERTHTLKQLQASEAKYRELFESVVAGVFQTSPEGRFISANPALVRMLGYESEEELLALDITRDIYMYPEDRANWRKAIDKDGKIRNAELVLRKKDGSKIVVLENSRAETDEQGQLIYFEGTLTDITETHEQSAQLSFEASHDPLTGVFNRREFERRLQSLLDNIHVQPGPHAICYMDLDRFKAINDNCGHVAGDELLRQVAEQLQSRVRHGDTLSRLGGDEFALILHDCGEKDAVRVAEGLRTMVDELRFAWSGQIHTIGASIGVVPISPERRRLSEVMGAADAACYRAKDSGRNCVHLFVEDDTTALQRLGELGWVARVKQALQEDRFQLAAQPIKPMGNKADFFHYELLVRMLDEEGREIPPGAFFPAVERYNLSIRMDRWIIIKALAWLTENSSLMNDNSKLFINLSADSITDAGFADTLSRQISESGISGGKLCFEISENIATENLSAANRFMSKLKDQECQFALDNFGNGISSFAYLKNLVVDYVKIDGVFVRSMGEDDIDQQMVKSINEICHALGKKTIAEHVESEKVIRKLQKLKVDYAQGYAISRPLPIDQIIPSK
ncbi:MAG: EAL domain-containing protein [Gammaproteobacteria bacterium]|nr:EAL domain-containing protein [Gammaproteobacteria bacterium]